MAYEKELTDPITELVEFADALRAHDDNKQSQFHQIISIVADVGNNSPEMFDIIGSVNHRLARLQRLVETVEDVHAKPRVRRLVSEALSNYASAFAAGGLGTQWHQVREGILTEAMLAQLQTFSSIAEKHRPLVRLSSDDRNKMMQEIDDLIAGIQNDGDLEQWVSSCLVEALDRLKFLASHLQFFGQEYLIDQLTITRGRTEAMYGNIAISSGAGLETIGKTLAVVALVGELFCLPANVSEATQKYYGWLHGPIAQTALPAPTRKLLQDLRTPKSDNNDTGDTNGGLGG